MRRANQFPLSKYTVPKLNMFYSNSNYLSHNDCFSCFPCNEEFKLRNVTVCHFVQNFSIPVGTSGHLKDLLKGLLKRNPRDRLDFGNKSLFINKYICFNPELYVASLNLHNYRF